MTVTGADDSVSPVELAAISKDFPFVEWGILFSQKRQGTLPKYPTARWLQALDALADANPAMRLSAHLCGQYVRDIFEKDIGDVFRHYTMRGNGFWHYSRLQLNGFSDYFKDKGARIPKSFQSLSGTSEGVSVICQVANEHAHLRAGALETVFGNVAALYDTSGGEGIPMPGFDCLVPPPTATIHVGYAGGLKVGTVAKAAADCKQQWADRDNHFWLDIETGVRSDGGKTFDLKKAVTVLEEVAPLIDFPPT